VQVLEHRRRRNPANRHVAQVVDADLFDSTASQRENSVTVAPYSTRGRTQATDGPRWRAEPRQSASVRWPAATRGVRHRRSQISCRAGASWCDACERWLSRWVLSLAELDRLTLAEVSRRLGIGDEGQALANETVRRYRRVAHSCLRRAVELEQIPADPWPPTPRGRSHRKVNQTRSAVDVRRLPNPARAVAILDALRNHQPGSFTYQAMTAVVYYAGLRPSEVVMLRPRALRLPATGWGSLEVTEADIDWDEPGDPKTGNRTTPVPPRLVELLRSWIDERDLSGDALMFRTREGNRPSESNWSRALKRACENAGCPRIRVYDFRHANATMMIKARVPLAEAARRLGHSVETLVSTYIGAMEGDDTEANALIDEALAKTRERIVAAEELA
jgi:integrase